MNMHVYIKPHYDIDYCDYINNTIYISGWFFIPEMQFDKLVLNIKEKNNEYNFDINYGFERQDIMSKYKSSHAKYSGFTLTCEFFPKDDKISLYLKYLINNNEYKIKIQKIYTKNKFLYKFNYLKKKLTIHNLFKFIKFIFTGKYKLLYFKLINLYKKNNNLAVNNLINISEWINNNVISEIDIKNDFYFNETVDIIIPIYNGYEYLDILFKNIKKTNIKYRLFIINDCSTDARINEYLITIKDDMPNAKIIHNKTNTGFVKSVNKALSLTQNHAVLLNTDIELPEYWLERLMYPIINNNKVASSTPFTNCGTICSFPVFCKDNPLFENLSCKEIDSGFQKIKPSYAEIPTGVGFCMGLNRETVNEIGLFDEDTFEKGYGEENDWCRRAIKAGYKNIIAENLFVYHKHGGTFSEEEKQKLNDINFKKLVKKHPNYEADVSKYISKDPSKYTREFISIYLINKHKINNTVLIFDHNIGGGAGIYGNNLINEKKENNLVISLKYDINTNIYLIGFYYNDYKYLYYIGNINDIFSLLNIFSCNEIYINELATYPLLKKSIEAIINIKKKYNSKLFMLLHDYYCICPTITLLNENEQYCGLPEIELCNKCYKRIINNKDYLSVNNWRENWSYLLNSCDEIKVFSNDSKLILEKYYKTAASKIKVEPHIVDYIKPFKKKKKITKTVNIGLIGMLGYHKGLFIIQKMLDIIKNKKLDVKIILLGSSENQMHKHPNYAETGLYRKNDLPSLTLNNDIDIIFISSIWPETFSYTTEEAIKMNMPVASFNIGAQAERISVYHKGLIINKIDAETALMQIMEYYNTKIKLNYEQ